MKALYIILVTAIFILVCIQTKAFEAETQQSFNNVIVDSQDNQYDQSILTMPDPIEPFNRVMFQLNDKLYFYFFKPVAMGYSFIVPETVRLSVFNFFTNLASPIRLTNCLLQGRINDASNEFTRFCINSIYGIAGLFDPARNYWDLPKKEEDFGQTLGVYGVGPGFYLVLPFFGPSSLRDGIGILVDFIPDPMTYLLTTVEYMGMDGVTKLNYTSLHIGEYEQVKRDSIDPYLAVRDAYAQYRAGQLKQ